VSRREEARHYIERGQIVEKAVSGEQFWSKDRQYVPKYEQDLLVEDRRRARKEAKQDGSPRGMLFDDY